MVRYCDPLYLTEHTKKNLEKIKRKLFTGAGMTGVYFILLSRNEQDVFDIVPAAMFKQRRFRRLDHIVIGIAESMRASEGLVQEIIEEHVRITGSYLALRRDIEERIVG
ncbi:MAG: hypothetical protein K6G83_15425 [Lachnospiraceae bacterium]|nr:hypothetical protein [Lachnospiraceae bacterium]